MAPPADRRARRRGPAEGAGVTKNYKLPYTPADIEPHILRDIAAKIERGEPLLTGYADQGVRYIERDIAVAVLRALADGGTVASVLRIGAPRTPWQVTLARVSRAIQEHGTRAAAFKAIAKEDTERRISALTVLDGSAAPISPDSVRRRFNRARAQEREYYRRAWCDGSFLSCWPVDATDDEIAAEAAKDGFMEAEDEETMWRNRRDALRAQAKRLTGWKVLPKR